MKRWSTSWFAGLAVGAFLLGGMGSACAGLLAAWEFNAGDVSGSSVDASAGTAANTTGALVNDANIASGTLDLDGNGDYLRFGDNVSDLRGLSAMTLAAWVNADSSVSGDRRRIVEHEDNFYFWADGEDGDDSFQYTTHGTSGGYPDARAVSSTAPSSGSWQHVVAVYDGGAEPARIYVDGVLEGTSISDQSTMPNNSHTFQIGARRSSSGNPGWFWDGQLDDIAIWDEVLTVGAIGRLAGKDNGGYAGRVTPTRIPEPASVVLLFAGLLGVLSRRTSRRSCM